ncbi:hypothetical protein HDU67_008841 [Dinochytrium kinnereticum]|nr:hypothetical protein HDU67_008841 [Dinochytrium kinnereticum]
MYKTNVASPSSAPSIQAAVKLPLPFSPPTSSSGSNIYQPRREILGDTSNRQDLDLETLTKIGLQHLAAKTTGDVSLLAITDRYQDADGLLHIYTCETYEGVKVFNQASSVHLDSYGNIVISNFPKEAIPRSTSTTSHVSSIPSLTAFATAAKVLGQSFSVESVRVEGDKILGVAWAARPVLFGLKNYLDAQKRVILVWGFDITIGFRRLESRHRDIAFELYNFESDSILSYYVLISATDGNLVGGFDLVYDYDEDQGHHHHGLQSEECFFKR